jgi:hypothetical protein
VTYDPFVQLVSIGEADYNRFCQYVNIGTYLDNTIGRAVLTRAIILKILGAALAFGIGLNQYRKSEAWKRLEFVAAQR